VKRSKKVWGITEVHSLPVPRREKLVKADDIFTHLLAAFAAATRLFISSPQRIFSTWFAG